MSASWGMRLARPTLIVLGCAIGTYGVLKLVADGQVWQVAPWAVGPVIVHDGLFAPLLVVGGWLASRYLPPYAKTPVLTGAVVTAGLVLIGASVVTRPGALADNPTLLDRNYGVGLLLALVVVWGVVAIWTAVARRRPTGRDGAGSTDSVAP